MQRTLQVLTLLLHGCNLLDLHFVISQDERAQNTDPKFLGMWPWHPSCFRFNFLIEPLACSKGAADAF